MNVSKKSWHYRVLNYFDLLSTYRQDSLCGYFWKVAFALFGIPLIGVVAIALVTMPLWWWLGEDLLSPAIAIALLEIGALLTIWYHHRKDIRRAAGLPAREPSIVLAWVDAKEAR